MDQIGWSTLFLWSTLCTEIVERVPISYRIAGILTLFLYLWGWNVVGMERAGVPFRAALKLKPTDSDADAVFAGARLLSLVLVLCYIVHEVSLANDFELGANMASVVLWVLSLLLLTRSQRPMFKEARIFLSRRVNTFVTASEVQFVDVLFADALTSISKVLADLKLVYCGAVVAVLGTSVGDEHCITRLLPPVLASLPYAIRAFQCYLTYQYKNDRPQLINLGKYLSSFPVIWTSALKYELTPAAGQEAHEWNDHLEALWLYAVIINTTYSFGWDIYMDWGLGHTKRNSYFFLRPRLMYKSAWVYYVLMIQNLALRACWSLKLSSHLQIYASGPAMIFMFEIFEVFRRWAWIYFRIEWEVINKGIEVPDADKVAENTVQIL